MRIRFTNQFTFRDQSNRPVVLDSLPAGANLYIFGAGGRGAAVLDQVWRQRADVNILGCMDTFKTGSLGSVPILKPEHAVAEVTDRDTVVIATFCHTAVAMQLQKLGLERFWIARQERQQRLWRDYKALYPKPAPYQVSAASIHRGPGLSLETKHTEGLKCEAVEGECAIKGSELFLTPNHDGIGKYDLEVSGEEEHAHKIRINLEETPWPHITLQPNIDRLITLHLGDIAWKPESEIVDQSNPMPEAERRRVYARFASVVTDDDDDYNNACRVARSLIDALYDFQGNSGDNAKLATQSPMDLYEAAIRGSAAVECGHYAEFFSAVCNSFGILARRVSFGNVEDKGSTRLQIGTGHAANEIYCRSRRQWIWMDLQAQVLGAEAADDILLNTLELQSFLDSGRRDRLRFLVHEPKSDRMMRLAPGDAPPILSKLLCRTYIPNQEITLEMM